MLVMILAGGGTLTGWLIGGGFVLTLPYLVIGFWNSVIGLWLRHVQPQHLLALPGVAALSGPAPERWPAVPVALLMTLRNEPPEASFERLARMRRSLQAAGGLSHVVFAILSDSDVPAIRQAETQCFRRFADQHPRGMPPPVYRHRSHNTGYKAGNIQDFLQSRGHAFRYFVPLDSDSLMSADTLERMIAFMEAHADIGILQSLAVGMPAKSGFARIFQFGMRHGMRVFTTGAAWWMADCGSYWGHNAVIRTAPFREHCPLPRLPGRPPLGGFVLSHDQVEACLMRRAGYEVRVIPVETGSFEINPPSLPDFIRRELRWCQGNMQYFRLLRLPGLRPTSRAQLFMAIGMYLAQAAWMFMIAIGCIGALAGNFHPGNLKLGMILFVSVFVLSLAPKLTGVIDVCLTRGGTRRYGGTPGFLTGALLEIAASMVMAPVVAFSIACFLPGLLFGKAIRWSGQRRDQYDLSWYRTARRFAPHLAAGILLTLALAATGGLTAIFWALPLIAGLVFAVPYSVFTAGSRLARWLDRRGLFRLPEEQTRPAILNPLNAASGP